MTWRTDQVEHFSDLPYSPQKRREQEKREAEAQERLDASVGPLMPKEAPERPPRPFRDLVRDYGEGVTAQQRERWASADYHKRRAEAMTEKPSETEKVDTTNLLEWWERTRGESEEPEWDFEDD